MSNKALKMSEIVLVKYLFKEDWSPLEEVVSKNSGQFGDVHDIDNEKDLLMILESSPATLVIASVSGKEALTSVIGFLKTHRKIVKDSNMKFSVVNFLNNKQVEAALMKMGCQEVMEPTMRDKALKFKIDFWKKALSIGQKKSGDDVKLTLKDKQAETEKAKVEQNPIQWVPALKTVDDMWLIKNTQDVKKVLTKWMVKVMGPSPFVAQWTEVPGQRGVWKFNFKEGIRDTFHSGDGHWFFKGEQKPEFIWKENLWMISGQNFQLFYQDEGEVIARFRASPQAVEVAKNSSYALSRERAIIESFDQEILVKKGLADDNSKTEIEEDKKGDGLLTQDMSGEEAISSKYKGNVTQELQDAPEEKKKLAIDAKTAGRLKGKSSTDDLGGGTYEGDVENANQNKKDSKKHNGSSDHLDNSDGDAGTDDVGASKYKGKMEYSQSDRKSDYGGESSTDDLGSDKWSNQTNGQAPSREAKEREEIERSAKKERGTKEVEERTAKEKPAQDRYDGESDTDDLGSSHWSGKKKTTQEEKAAKAAARGESYQAMDEQEELDEEVSSSERRARQETAKEKGDRVAEKAAVPMRGKTATDDLGEDHYSGPGAKKKATSASSEKERTHTEQIEQEEADEQDSGIVAAAKAKKKSSAGTDDLGPAHYGGKTKRAEALSEDEEEASGSIAAKKKKVQQGNHSDYQEDEKEDYGGAGQSDDLGSSHYKGKTKKPSAIVDADEEESGRVERVAKDKTSERTSKVDSARKIRMLDDLLPEGEGEAEMEAGDISGFDEPTAVDVEMDRPKLVVNNGPIDKQRPASAKGNAPTAKEKLVVASKTTQAEAEDEPVIGDDGKPVTNDQVTVKAVLSCESFGNVERIVHVDDFFDSTAIVKMQQEPPQSGESIRLTVSFSYQKSNKRVTVSGKCLETDSDDEGGSFCTIELAEADRKLFEQFMALYRLRQQHVTQFLKAAKGL